jgi:ABC-type multidrug transport system ATPase subunit
MRETSAPIPYGPFARLSDWWQAWRDGMAGVPAPERGIATTGHREVLIRWAQDAFERERLEYEKRRAEKLERAAAIQVRLERAVEEADTARAVLADVSEPPSDIQLEQRRPGEEFRKLAMVRLRRLRDHARAVQAARQQVEAKERTVSSVAAELAAATEAVERETVVAGARVRRIHEHVHRRLSAYRRRLVRSHPEGDWVNVAMDSRSPMIPGWAVVGFDETALMELEPFDEPPDLGDWQLSDPEPDVVPLGAVTTIGAVAPAKPLGDEHVVLAGYGIAAHHATLTRRGEGYRLQDHGRGNSTSHNGVPVSRVDLAVGDTFEIGEYELRVRADALEVRFFGKHELVVTGMCAETKNGKKLLTDMTFAQRPGTVMAVIGPSGAGKSTLFGAVLGELRLSEGHRYLQRHDLATYPGLIRNSLGYVPQGDGTMHHGLTVRQLLGFSDRLRRPPDRQQGRRERIRAVCDELGLDKHLDSTVGSLSGGERRRVSIALEILAQPRLLMLDEPTSGLDAAKDEEVMRMLRRYARKDGNSVITVTHNTEHLDLVDEVLVVARGGRPVHLGPPDSVLDDLGAGGYTTLMARLTASPDLAAIAYQRSPAAENARAVAKAIQDREPQRLPTKLRRRRSFGTLLRQLPVLVRRQFVLVAKAPFQRIDGPKDWLAATSSVFMPVLVAAVGALLTALVVGGEPWRGPSRDDPSNAAAHTALSLLVTLTMLGGQALSYSDIVAEYPVIQREHRTGVLAAAVVLSKWLVFASMSVVQGTVVAMTFVLVTSAPERSLVAPASVELAFGLAATSIASMSAGLLISVLAKRLEHAVAMATGAAIAQVALSGGLSSLDGERVQQVIAWFLPARWGFGVSSSSVDLRGISPGEAPDALWRHDVGQWTANLGMLAFLAVVYTSAAVFVLRRSLRTYRR